MKPETRAQVQAALNQTFVNVLLNHQDVSMSHIFSVIESMRGTEIKAEAPAKAAEAPAAPAKAAKAPRAPRAAKAAPAKASKKAAPAAAAADANLPDLRTQAGRAAFDQVVLNAVVALGGTGVAARTLADKIPGDEEQRRNALKRLIKAGLVTLTGERAATRYSVVAQDKAN